MPTGGEALGPRHPRQRAALTGHTGFVESVAFSPDGKTLATTAIHEDRDVRLWDVATGEQTATLPRSERPTWANGIGSPARTVGSVEPDRPYDFRTLTILDAGTDAELATLAGHPDQLNDWAFHRRRGPGDRGRLTAHPWPVNSAGDVGSGTSERADSWRG